MPKLVATFSATPPDSYYQIQLYPVQQAVLSSCVQYTIQAGGYPLDGTASCFNGKQWRASLYLSQWILCQHTAVSSQSACSSRFLSPTGLISCSYSTLGQVTQKQNSTEKWDFYAMSTDINTKNEYSKSILLNKYIHRVRFTGYVTKKMKYLSKTENLEEKIQATKKLKATQVPQSSYRSSANCIRTFSMFFSMVFGK